MDNLYKNRTFVYQIDTNDIITFVNDEWLAFAQENDTQNLTPEFVLDQSLWKFIADKETRHLYQTIIDKVRSATMPVKIPFRCDSPTRRRFMELEIIPISQECVEFHSRILNQEFREPNTLLDVAANRSGEFLTMCSWCKKVKLPSTKWVEVEEAIVALSLFETSRLPQITHGMCPTCSENYRKEFEAFQKHK